MALQLCDMERLIQLMHKDSQKDLEVIRANKSEDVLDQSDTVSLEDIREMEGS